MAALRAHPARNLYPSPPRGRPGLNVMPADAPKVPAMSLQPPDADSLKAFIAVCGRVLGLSPDPLDFRPHVDRAGRATVTWTSFAKGMGGQMVERDYRDRFGPMPDWTAECHLHHQHLLRLASIFWGQALPLAKPEVIAPPPGGEDDYRIPAPPVVRPPRWPAIASDGEMLARLASSAEFEQRLQREFGFDRAGSMRSVMIRANLDESDSSALMDFITEDMRNHSAVVWKTENSSSDIDGCEEAWPIEVHEYCGLFQVRSPEHDETGPFLSLEDAQRFVSSNWPDSC